MKKILFAIFTIGIILIMSCEPEVEPNPFVGTWEHEDGSGQHIVFTEKNATFFKQNGDIYWKGSYTYDDAYMTIIWEYKVEELNVWGNTVTMWYKFEDGKLLLGGQLFIKRP